MSTLKLRNHYDVVIIGAGPVGTGLAIDLVQRGHSVCLVEKYQASQRIPKGQNLTQRSGEHLSRWGVSAAVREATLIPPEYGNQGITAYGSWLSGRHYDWFKRASVRDYYFADNERLPQYETERVLRDRANSFSSLDLITDWSFESHHEHSESIDVLIESSEDATQHRLQACWLVGCDGARSRVREHSGIKQSIDAHDRRMALVTFRSAELNDLLVQQFPGRTIFNAIHPDLKGYWQFLGRTDPHDSFFFHAPVAEDAVIESFDFAALLQRAAGVEVQAELDYVGFWDLRFTQANNYRRGRVFVAGDAAHSHPPYGGYGVNLGFEDARNLAWKLDASLSGWGSDSLLDSYNDERHPVFASTRDHFIARMIESDAEFTSRFDPDRDPAAFEVAWQARAEGGQAEVELYVPNYSGSPIVAGADNAKSSAVGEHSHIASAGFHLSPRAVRSDANIFDLLGPGFSLITLDVRAADIEKFTDAAVQLAIPLNVILASHNEDNPASQADMILVRPDEHVAWTGSAAEANPEQVLRSAAGR